MGDMMMDDLEDEESQTEQQVNTQSYSNSVSNTEVVRGVTKDQYLGANSVNPYTSSTAELELFIEEDVHVKDANIQSLEMSLKKTKSGIVKKESLSVAKTKSLEELNHDESSKLLVELLKQNESFKEKLRLAQRAIHIRDDQIGKLKASGSILPLDMAQARVHLSFMFSSPLIRKFNNKTENIMQLDYLNEISDIIKVCKKMKHEMKFKTEVATVSNMISVITDGPIALHFSGHGIQNAPENLGTDYTLHKNKGNILLLEDEQGMADYFFEEDIKNMIEMTQTTFEVVFVSSCHSQFAGEVFLNAGAKHVVCIKGGEKISDRASLRFSKVFYETLFVKNYNVCTSFHIAKEEISKVIGNSEANKFVLLIQEKDN